ncbi:MAG: transcription repressor NadR [Bacillota bacterium]|nr:transcription repressor NadR [Bacillota bacterium]
MDGDKRRQEIKNMLSNTTPISAAKIAKYFNVSRQVIVQDIALLRALNSNIISTSKGYILNEGIRKQRIFEVCHTNDQIADELNTIVDAGGRVIDVFINHKIYGEFRATLFITSRRDVNDFVELVKSEKVSPLKQLTDEYHYHTVEADSEEILDIIEKELDKKHYLARHK